MTHVATGLGAPLSTVLTIDDLDILETEGGVVVLATSRASGQVTSYTLGPSSASFMASTELPEIADRLGGAALEIWHLDSGPLLFSAVGSGGEIASYHLSDGALLDSGVTLQAPHLDRSIMATAEMTVAGQHYVFTGNLGEPGVGVYRMATDGSLQNLRDPGANMLGGGEDISALLAVQIADASFLISASALDSQLSCYQVTSAGALQFRGSLGVAQGFGISAPQALSSVTIDGETYVLAASSQSSSISVLRLGPDGGFTPTDHLVDDQFSRFQGVSVIETLEVDGRAFVLAGGADGGVTLFQLLPHGQLFMMDVQEDLDGLSLGQVAALEMHVMGGRLHILAGSSNEAGVTHLTVDLPSFGVTETAADGAVLIGSSASDVLYDADGNERLNGGAGDDILIGGIGSDRFSGGAGQDVFVVAGDGQEDRILDFELGQDMIDLTGWSGLYGLAELQFSSTSGGGRVSFRGESLLIQTSNGASLSVSDMQSAILQNFTRTTLPDLDQPTIFRGTSGDDNLQGGAGNDLLQGFAGADTLNGGAGTDAVSYADSRGSLRVDLLFPHINTNVAAGDTYIDIEDLLGSQGFDNLRGTFGDNYIFGDRNVDYIFGRRGDDTLEGGIGDDVLFGGVGRDVLIGGEHRDRAQYSESLTAVIVDLANPHLNTGEAAGDSYFGIEDLAGGRFADQLFGDAQNNRLFGREGADTLIGRDGDDYLNGGAHGDWLDGGAGDDTLRGGTHADTFIFNDGHDHIEDFNIAHGDEIALDRAALELEGMATSDVVLAYGSIVNGQVVLNFSDSHSLTIESLSSLTGLEDDLVFV